MQQRMVLKKISALGLVAAGVGVSLVRCSHRSSGNFRFRLLCARRVVASGPEPDFDGGYFYHYLGYLRRYLG